MRRMIRLSIPLVALILTFLGVNGIVPDSALGQMARPDPKVLSLLSGGS